MADSVQARSVSRELRLRASEAHGRRRWNKALALWTLLAAREPDQPMHQIRAGECLRQLDRDEEAATRWAEAGRRWSELFQWSLAMGALRMALQLRPGEPQLEQRLESILRLRRTERDRRLPAPRTGAPAGARPTPAAVASGVVAATAGPALIAPKPVGLVPTPVPRCPWAGGPRAPEKPKEGNPGGLGSQPVERASRGLGSVFERLLGGVQGGEESPPRQQQSAGLPIQTLFARAAGQIVPPSPPTPPRRRWRIVRDPHAAGDEPARIDEVAVPRWTCLPNPGKK